MGMLKPPPHFLKIFVSLSFTLLILSAFNWWLVLNRYPVDNSTTVFELHPGFVVIFIGFCPFIALMFGEFLPSLTLRSNHSLFTGFPSFLALYMLVRKTCDDFNAFNRLEFGTGVEFVATVGNDFLCEKPNIYIYRF
jgi:hypothetical protein